jgi:SPP1 gp7 family putative phage head morphogenesis protein
VTSAFAHHVSQRRMLGARIHARRVRVPQQRQPNAERLAYATALMALIAEALRLLREHLLPALPSLVNEAGQIHDAPGRTYADKVQALIEQAANAMFRQMTSEKLRGVAMKFGERTSRSQREQFKRQLRAVFGQELGAEALTERGISDRVEAWASENAHLIRKMTRGFYDEVSQRVVQGLRKGQRAEEIAADIAERHGVSESKARLIARDQIGKLNGELNKARQKNLGIDSFIWRGVMDERERDEHVALEGRKFKWSDPPDEGIPGESINCRCSAEPAIEDLLESL